MEENEWRDGVALVHVVHIVLQFCNLYFSSYAAIIRAWWNCCYEAMERVYHVQQIFQPVSSDIFWNLIHEKLLAVGFAFGIYHQSLPTEAANIETNLQNWLFFWKWGYRISIYSHFPFGSRIVAWTLHVPVPIQLETYCISYLFILPVPVALEKFAAVRKLEKSASSL